MRDSNPPSQRVLQRAHLPEVLFAEDVAAVLEIGSEHAAAGLRAGLLGPSFFVSGRPAVLRADLFETIRLRAAQADRAGREVLPTQERGDHHD